jgi:hypothetical protein
LIGTGVKGVCTQCHTEGDSGFVAAGKMRQELEHLAASIDGAEQILTRAERSGMEVSQAKLELTQARDSLVKARVTIHSVNLGLVQADIKSGLSTAAADYEAGEKALAERNYRRVGLAFSLVAIAIVVVGLRLYIRKIEQ